MESVVLDVIMDLDDCLYSRACGIADTVRENIIGERGSARLACLHLFPHAA